MQKNRSAFVALVFVAIVGVGVYLAISNGRGASSTGRLSSSASEPLLQSSSANQPNQPNIMEQNIEAAEDRVVTLKTNKGDISIKLYLSQTPVTAGNFLTLAQNGFYENVKFHRVIEGFMIQGGDPNTKTDDEGTYGTGGPGHTIPDEFAPGLSNVVGTISMANAGPNTGGSQFFINTADNTFLDGRHAVFGEVVEGMDVVRAIEATETKERDIPVEPVVIQKVLVEAE